MAIRNPVGLGWGPGVGGTGAIVDCPRGVACSCSVTARPVLWGQLAASRAQAYVSRHVHVCAAPLPPLPDHAA